MLVLHSDVDLLINEHSEEIRKKPNHFYFNEKHSYEVRPKDGFVMLVTGKKGSGKTYMCAGVCDQFVNMIAFDPTPDKSFIPTLEKIGVGNDWVSWDWDSTEKNCLKFNICDCGRTVVSAIFSNTLSNVERKQSMLLEQYFKQPKEHKNWESFVDMCNQNKLAHYIPEFAKVFSKKDKGVSIEDIQRGKHVISIYGLDYQSLSLGILFSMIADNRGYRNASGLLDPFGKDFLVCYIDEAQDYARINTSLGNAFAVASKQWRKLGIGLIASGSIFKSQKAGFHPDLRRQKDLLCIFRTEGSLAQYKDEGYPMIADDWGDLPQYFCYVFDSRRDIMDFYKTCFDSFFLDLRLALVQSLKKRVIENDDTDYSFVFNKQSFDKRLVYR